MKKKLVVIDNDHRRTGSTASLKYLLNELTNEFNVVVLTPKNNETAKECFGSKIQTIKYSNRYIAELSLFIHFSDGESFFSVDGIAKRIKNFIKLILGTVIFLKELVRLKPDLIYLNEYVVIQAGIAGKLLGVPTISHIRSRFLVGNTIRDFLRRTLILAFTDFRICISSVEADQFNHSNKTEVVGEFLNESDFDIQINTMESSLSGTIAQPYFLFVGGINRIKGTLDFIKASTILIKQNVNCYFVIVGKIISGGTAADVAYHKECLKEIENFKERFIVLDEISSVGGLFRDSLCFVSANTLTHFSRPAIEAWAIGKPVIVSDTLHNRELVLDGVNGMLFKLGDYDDLANKMRTLFASEQLRNELGKKGNIIARERFSAGINGKKIISIINKLLIKD